MPELPEVDFAAAIARRALVGRRLVSVHTTHPSQRRSLPARDIRQIVGHEVLRVDRRGKHQHIILDNGALIAVHFRMNGDWEIVRSGEPLPNYARIVFAASDGARLCLVDSRALCAAAYHPPGRPPRLALGPEPDSLTVAALQLALARRAGPIKTVLLDQRVVAGLGNIYVAESLWRARLHPARRASSLSRVALRSLVRGIKGAIADGFARQGRYRSGMVERPFNVYDREGEPCPRCRSAVRRMSQAGRSTYWCATCQSGRAGK